MAHKNNHICVLLSIIFLALCSGYVAQVHNYFKLVQQWPPAFCKTNSCSRTPTPFNFTIHGLWPDNSAGQFLMDCYLRNRAPRFSTITDSELVRRLDVSWRDLIRPMSYATTLQPFWKHEWDKHGTCSWNLFHPQKLYFEKALVLKDKFDLLKILQDNNIYPGNEVDVRHVTSVISRATGADPIVKCMTNRHAKTTKEAMQLTEIIICFDFNAVSVIPCPSYKGKCPKSKVYFPK